MTLGKLTCSFLVLISFIGLNNSLTIGSDSKADQSNLDSAAAFQRLKKLNGEWTGTVESKQGPAAVVSYHLTANGNTLMETLFPGSDHEMISMYYLDGKDLMLTHYCTMGNQPKMKLAQSKPDALTFDFAGGTNLDAKKDVHIHSGKIIFLGDDHLEAEWTVFQGDKQVGANRFFLTRSTK